MRKLVMLALAAVLAPCGARTDDAFGLVHATHRGHPMWWYSGGDMDGSTYMAYFPDTRVTLICLSNLLGGDCEGRTRKVLDVLLP